jgi:eukaryotic-like serine/threonine-protein kinase
MLLAPDQSLGPYEIVALLNSGGMGEVYKARDTRLGRFVAVKVLTGLGREHGEAADRFRREAQAAGALNHPNLLLVHDVGDLDGLPYLVSEFIEGGTLREALSAGALAAPLVLKYGGQLARGLQAAHARGIVHRDLKPENVMLTGDGRAKIVDFGLAVADAPLDGEAGTVSVDGLRTVPGTLLGTFAYMSPEQVRGAPVDHRADIFALGVVLFEMVEGVRPFGGATAAEVIAAILRDDVPPMRFAPPALELVVRRCLEKAPALRYQDAGEVADALEMPASPLPPSPLMPTPRGGLRAAPTVAVLPFGTLGSAPDSEYFSDGLVEELIHELSRIRGLQVVAWDSASKMKGRTDDVQRAGAQLGAARLLTGSIRRAGDRVRIVARLLETASGFLLWSGTYDRRVEDLFAIQEEIARSIVRTLADTLQLTRVGGPRQQPASHEAYDLYLKGRYFWNKRTRDGLARGIECFEQAIALDPSSAAAHAGLADAYCLMVDYGHMAPGDAMPRARRAALDALAADPRSPEAHASLGLIRGLHDWEWLESEALFRRALELNPGYATAHHWLAADLLAAVGRLDEAHEEIEIARRLDPLSLIIAEGHAHLYILGRRYEDAVAGFRSLLDLDPAYYKAYSSMGRALLQLGRHSDAIEMLEKGRELAGDVPNILAALGQAHGLAGRPEAARALLDQLGSLARDRYVQTVSFALVHAGLGEHEAALDWLERGLQRRDPAMSGLKIHPAYDALRGLPRFEAILRTMRFDA